MAFAGMYQSICTVNCSGIWALAWAQVVIFIALACHVADSQPSPHQFCFAKGCFAARQWWTKALVGVRLSFFE
jgi:hypothetical protein